MEKYNHIISLGYVCNVTSYLNSSKNRDTAYVFDRMATPMWAVNELMKNNFEDLLETVKCEKLFERSSKPIPYDSKYYIRLPLQPSSYEQRVLELKEKLKERADRLKSILMSGESVLFIRDEEPTEYPDLGSRLNIDQYSEKYAKSEREYIKELCDYIKLTYPSLQFKVLFLNNEGEFVEDSIVGIPRCDVDYRDMKVGAMLKKHINKYEGYLNTNL